MALNEPVASSVQSAGHSISGETVERSKKAKRCAIKGCMHAVHARALCATHYRRLQRGDEDPTRPVRTEKSRDIVISTRVTPARVKLLNAEAKKLGFGSLYALAAEILEKWVPPSAPLPPARGTEQER